MAPDESVYTSLGMDNESLVAQMQGMSLQQEVEITPDHELFSWMEDEGAVFTNDASNSTEGAPFV